MTLFDGSWLDGRVRILEPAAADAVATVPVSLPGASPGAPAAASLCYLQHAELLLASFEGTRPRNSGAILAQFRRNSGAILRNFSDASCSSRRSKERASSSPPMPPMAHSRPSSAVPGDASRTGRRTTHTRAAPQLSSRSSCCRPRRRRAPPEVPSAGRSRRQRRPRRDRRDDPSLEGRARGGTGRVSDPGNSARPPHLSPRSSLLSAGVGGRAALSTID